MSFQPDSNKVYFIQSRSSAKVLDIADYSTTPGGKVHQWTYHGDTNQQFKFEKVNNNQYYICNVRSGLYLDGAITNIGNPIKQQQKSSSNSQLWSFQSGHIGAIRIQNVASGRFIDIEGARATEGTNVITYRETGGTNQAFTIRAAVPTKLYLQEIQCIQAAAGTFMGGVDIASMATTIGGGGVGVLGAGLAVAGVTTGGTAIAVVGAVIGVAGIAACLTGIIDKFASEEDDLYIKMNGNKIWPAGAHSGVDTGENIDFNDKLLSSNWQNSYTLQLWDHDTISGDDALTDKIKIDPAKAIWDYPFTIFTGSDSAGSAYCLTFYLS